MLLLFTQTMITWDSLIKWFLCYRRTDKTYRGFYRDLKNWDKLRLPSVNICITIGLFGGRIALKNIIFVELFTTLIYVDKMIPFLKLLFGLTITFALHY